MGVDAVTVERAVHGGGAEPGTQQMGRRRRGHNTGESHALEHRALYYGHCTSLQSGCICAHPHSDELPNTVGSLRVKLGSPLTLMGEK